MVKVSIIKPESISELKKHLKYISYFHIRNELITDELGNEKRVLHLYTKVERDIKGVNTEYWLYYRISGNFSIHNFDNKYVKRDSPYNVFLSDDDCYPLKKALSEFKDNDLIRFEIYLNAMQRLFEKGLCNEMIYLKHYRYDNKISVYKHDDSVINYAVINHIYDGTYPNTRSDDNEQCLSFIHKLQEESYIYE